MGPGSLTKGPRQLGRVRCLSEDALRDRAQIRRIHSEMVGMVWYVSLRSVMCVLHHNRENPTPSWLLSSCLLCAEGLWETGRGADSYHFSVWLLKLLICPRNESKVGVVCLWKAWYREIGVYDCAEPSFCYYPSSWSFFFTYAWGNSCECCKEVSPLRLLSRSYWVSIFSELREQQCQR